MVNLLHLVQTNMHMIKTVGNVTFWSLAVSLGGFLFGFDTAVISGGEQAIQKLWDLSDVMVGQMVAMGLYGTIIGALTGGIPAERWGRKNTLFVIGILYLICSRLGYGLERRDADGFPVHWRPRGGRFVRGRPHVYIGDRPPA